MFKKSKFSNSCFLVYLCIIYISYIIIFQDTFGFTSCDSIVELSYSNDYGSNVHLNSNSNIESETFSHSQNDRENVLCLNPFPFYTYKNIVKRKLYWHLIAKGKRFESYKDFKPYWDPSTKIIYEIKNEFILRKRTFIWIINPRSRGRN